MNFPLKLSSDQIKKNLFLFSIIFLISCTYNISFSQVLHLKTQDLKLTTTTSNFSSEKVNPSEIVNKRYYRLMSFDQIPKQEIKEEIENQGILFNNYLPDNTYIVSIPKKFNKKSLLNYGITHVQKIPLIVKHDPIIFESPLPEWAQENNNIKISVTLMNDASIDDFQFELDKQLTKTLDVNSTVKIIRLSVPKPMLNEIINNPIVNYVSLISPIGEPEDIMGRSLHRSNAISTNYSGGRHYHGDSVSVGVNDDGFVGPHIDFQGRTEQSSVANDLAGDHGDMVAGILGGAGNLNPKYQGMAKGTKIYVRQYNSSLPGSVSLHNNFGVMLFSSSYGNGCNGGYTSLCRQVDQEIRLYPSLIQVFSCGNSGTQNCGYGAGSGWGNITGGHKQGKNVIATANLNYNGTLVNSSSRGPASDGRIKPDLAAHGNGQISTDPDNNYGAGSGTSAAAPGISGVLAQLYQAYRELNNGVNPESSLLKACMLNTAEDYGNTGPDFSFGWGRVNALKAVKVLEENRYSDSTITQGASNTHTIEIPEGIKEARIMVYWLDQEGSPSASKALVNDIDLNITNGNNTYLPWVLNSTPNASLLNSPATNGIDHLNNMEQVTLFNPSAGIYTANINGFSIPVGPQKYYLLYELIGEEITVTYPFGGERLLPNRTEYIHWDAVGNSGVFELEYSTDNGINWNPISTVGGSLRMKNWQVPNTVTSQAKIRITRNGFSDESDHTFTIIEDPNFINVDSVCICNVSISWLPVSGAAGYEIMVLGEKYMDSIGTTTETHYKIPVNDHTDDFWYTVRALTSDGSKGRRAVAKYYDGNGSVNCSVSSDFTANTTNICAGSPVLVNDLSIGCPTNWEWTFNPNDITFLNGTNSFSQNPEISFDFTGNYTITLNSYNSFSSQSLSKSNFINVVQEADLEILEDFENINFPPSSWEIQNLDNQITWIDTSVIGSDNNLSTVSKINNQLSLENTEDRLITFPIYLNEEYSNPYLFFDVSYSYLNAKEDELIVEISEDCDITFNDTIYYKKGQFLSTTPLEQTNWCPFAGSDWRKEAVPLFKHIGKTIKVSFTNKSKSGNQLYIDNINIKNKTDEEYDPLNFGLYPNPNFGSFSIHLENFNIDQVNITLIDARGRLIDNNQYTFNSTSSKSINCDTKGLAKGLYFIKVSNSENTKIKSFVII